jgi:hypothetical protein
MSVDLSYAERATAAPTLDFILIERRTLIQECLTAALKDAGHPVAPLPPYKVGSSRSGEAA